MGNKDLSIDIGQIDDLYQVSKALASKTRIQIVNLLRTNAYNVNEIANKLNIPTSSAALSVKLLEKAGIINSEMQPGNRGSMKVCSLRLDEIGIRLNASSSTEHTDKFTLSMPIGNFVDCAPVPTCGLINERGYIDSEDRPRSFYNPNRTSAQLIWMYKGHITYRFPNYIIDYNNVRSLEFSCELCSEAPNYRLVWPSDITVWVNGFEIGTWTSPGDLGGRRGKLNPDWWSDACTQYGLLKTFQIMDDGSYIDGQRSSDTTLEMLHLRGKSYVEFTIGIKENAKNVGGFNLFGEKFGDYEQNIVLAIYYN